MTQRELAEKMDISANHVGVLEREEKLPRASTIEALVALMTKDEMERRIIGGKASEAEAEELAKLVRSLNQLEEKKRLEVIRALVRLLMLI